MARHISRILDQLLPGSHVIGDAAAALHDWSADAPEAYCPRCGLTVGKGEATAGGCGTCRDMKLPWDHLTRLCAYVPPMRDWIHEMKFGRYWPWSRWLGDQLAASLPPMDDPIVVPIPLHWTRRMKRGFDQSVLIGRQISLRRHWPMARLVRRSMRTRPQSSLATQSDRMSNVRNAFEIVSVNLSGRSVVLVDDVKTSGATAGRCARLLRERGAGSIHLAVLAVGGAVDRAGR